MTDWKAALAEHANHLPFLMAVKTAAGDGTLGAKLNTTRIAESLIIAGVTGLIVMYGAQQKQDAMMQRLENMIAEQARTITGIAQRQDSDHREEMMRDDRIENKLDAHIQRGSPR